MFSALWRTASRAHPYSDGRLASQSGRAWLILASVPLGLILSVAIQTRPAAPIISDPSIRAVSVDTILHLEQEQRALKEDLRGLRAQVSDVLQEAAVRRVQLGKYSAELTAQRSAAGLAPRKGEGVRVTLDDSQGRTVPVGTDTNMLIVHDYDLRDVVALLWGNGAEAIAINGQRLVHTTSIFCVGSTILVNDTRLSPPYVVEAIGPASMASAISDPVALSRFKTLVRQYGLILGHVAVNELTVPPYDGRMATRGVAMLPS